MPNFTYPTNAEIQLIAQTFIGDITQADPIFGYFPMTTKDVVQVIWEQEDNYFGLQQIRGMDGEEPKVQPVGLKQYQSTPGVYGEQQMIKERELLERRSYGSFATPASLDDIVASRVRQMTVRQMARIRQILWTLAATGTFSVSTANGAVAQTDTFSLQTFTAAVSWATLATATPLADFSSAALQAAGYSVSFDASATAFMNHITWNNLRQNANSTDLYGRRTGGFGTYNTQQEINALFTGDNLPTVVVYDKGYYNDANSFTRFVPNNKVVIFGRRDDGAPLGNYIMTRNASNADMAPGEHLFIRDNANGNDPDPVPRKITIHTGHNGLPVIYFPSGVLIMSV